MHASEIELFERSVRQATESHTGDDLDRALLELGWLDALADDPYTAVSILFPLHGSTNSTSRALEQVVAAALGRTPTDAEAVVLPALGTPTAPGEGTGDQLSIRGLATPAIRVATDAVLAVAGGRERLAIVTIPTSELNVRAVAGIDPDFGLLEVITDRAAGRVCPDRAESRWGTTVILAQLALTYEILGAARAMLAFAREHALDRFQYGRPISSFQAVRHRLADTLVAIEAADAAVTAARDAPSPELAGVAKSLAGRSAWTTARHCQQVLAGIGFTAEHPFHRYYRRILLLDQLFGSAHFLTAALGDQLLRSRRLPALLPL